MSIKNFVASPIFTLLCAAVVVAVAAVLKPGPQVAGAYYAIAFWAVVGLDFYRTQVVENGASELDRTRYSFADRFLGYLFVAPLLFPARAVRFATVSVGRK